MPEQPSSPALPSARYILFGVSSHSPFTLFYPAVVVSALLFGCSSGLLTTTLSAARGLVFVVPLGSLDLPDLEEIVGVSVFICSVVGRLCTLNAQMAAAHLVTEQARGAAEAA